MGVEYYRLVQVRGEGMLAILKGGMYASWGKGRLGSWKRVHKKKEGCLGVGTLVVLREHGAGNGELKRDQGLFGWNLAIHWHVYPTHAGWHPGYLHGYTSAV